ncbi:MFS transporter [Streptomyces viridochromogenes]|uniref:MFS transporter n=1 Tax=Streptomyces viridochromogenes TaxID=1938 RepID=UPI00069D2206|nr:MFS transporter [Streptomyces viridochromogenes]KOG17740.1 major facilitator transporter [Streptomyces viridochromogenes]KOG18843.1 major facilitator transporter [Streptomyces viridochromogenes]
MSTKRNRAITLLSLGHACVDVYQGATAALVPYFVAERAYSYAAASGVVLAASLLSSVVQPLFGALTDRWAMPWLLPLSALTGGAGVALSGVMGSYVLTLTVVAVSGIGVAAYHPEAARAARDAAHGSHTAMGWFSLGGNVGFALAPPLVAAVAAAGGLGASPLLVVPAVVGAALCAAAVRSAPGGGVAADKAAGVGTDDWRSFLRLSGAVACRSIVFVGLSTFVSLYVRQRTGGGNVAGTAALCVLYVGGAVGTVAGGRLADRYGRLTVVRHAYVLTVVAVAGVVLVPGPSVYLFVALTSAGLYVPFSLHITLGQDYLPRRVGTASGVTLGLTVSVGGLAAPVVGALADATSLRTALVPLVALPALGRLLLCGLREPEAPGRVSTAPGACGRRHRTASG